MGFGRALADLAVALWTRPAEASRAADRAWEAWVGGALPIEKGDRRFRDPAWTSHAAFAGLRRGYLWWSRYLRELVDGAGLSAQSHEKAATAVDHFIEAWSPTNFFWTNPAALRRAWETGGLSVVRGARNFLHDLAHNGGRPSQVDLSGFELGRNLAATPGHVVFRNDLMELIQYEPQTPTVYETPLLLSPPWINKYYIMDLAPGRSFAEWAVSRGHTVFAISYRNPDETMRDVALDDYLLRGPLTALDVIGDVTGSEQANVVGLCLGGTLTAMLLAYLKAGGEERVRSATLLNTLIDFAEPGPMGCFLDRESVERLSGRMQRRGYLDGRDMSTLFDLLRARDLIWSYVASGWLLGEPPPAFDILAWNSDGTRMPAVMHAFYLRQCYVENQLAKGRMRLAGRRLRLSDVTADVYLLSAKEDHIAPWKSAYAATQLLGGPVRFVLSSSGHVAGIVNPPVQGGRRVHWLRPETGGRAPRPADPDAWLAGATEQEGSWWNDWAEWVGSRAGSFRPPPPMGSARHRPLAEAPGSYVLQS